MLRQRRSGGARSALGVGFNLRTRAALLGGRRLNPTHRTERGAGQPYWLVPSPLTGVMFPVNRFARNVAGVALKLFTNAVR